MIGIFSWKERSSVIIRIISDELNMPNKYDKDGGAEEDIKTADRTAFEESSLQRQSTLKLYPELDFRLQRWQELTNIDTCPTLPPRRTKSFNHREQPFLKRRCNRPNTSMPCMRLVLPEKLQNDMVLQQNDRCTISLKIQYLIITQRLKVTISQAKNIFKDPKYESNIVANAKVCLMPGKTQQHITQTVKGTNNPTFDTVFYFNGFSLHDIHQMCLRVKLNGRDRKFGPLKDLGKVYVCLDNLDLRSEISFEEALTITRTPKLMKR